MSNETLEIEKAESTPVPEESHALLCLNTFTSELLKSMGSQSPEGSCWRLTP